jgi:hypothetical protein
MNSADRPEGGRKDAEDGDPSPGPNLVVLYSLIALALAVAIGLAALIVLPFYQRR